MVQITSTFPYHKIVVVGSTGCGKSTLASGLAKRLGGDFIELDALHWEPNWVEASDDVFRARVEQATATRSWVVAGNYHVVRDIIWPQAQLILWLDYSLPLVFRRLLMRTIRRSYYREKIFSGNVENFRTHLKIWSEESLFHWLFKTYWRRKREYPILFASREHAHLKVIRFKHPHELDDWFREFTAA